MVLTQRVKNGLLICKKVLVKWLSGESFLKKTEEKAGIWLYENLCILHEKIWYKQESKVDTESYMQVSDCGLISIIFKEFFQVLKKVKKLSRVSGVFELKYLTHSIDSMQEGCQ